MPSQPRTPAAKARRRELERVPLRNEDALTRLKALGYVGATSRRSASASLSTSSDSSSDDESSATDFSSPSPTSSAEPEPDSNTEDQEEPGEYTLPQSEMSLAEMMQLVERNARALDRGVLGSPRKLKSPLKRPAEEMEAEENEEEMIFPPSPRKKAPRQSRKGLPRLTYEEMKDLVDAHRASRTRDRLRVLRKRMAEENEDAAESGSEGNGDEDDDVEDVEELQRRADRLDAKLPPQNTQRGIAKARSLWDSAGYGSPSSSSSSSSRSSTPSPPTPTPTHDLFSPTPSSSRASSSPINRTPSLSPSKSSSFPASFSSLTIPSYFNGRALSSQQLRARLSWLVSTAKQLAEDAEEEEELGGQEWEAIARNLAKFTGAGKDEWWRVNYGMWKTEVDNPDLTKVKGFEPFLFSTERTKLGLKKADVNPPVLFYRAFVNHYRICPCGLGNDGRVERRCQYHTALVYHYLGEKKVKQEKNAPPKGTVEERGEEWRKWERQYEMWAREEGVSVDWREWRVLRERLEKRRV